MLEFVVVESSERRDLIIGSLGGSGIYRIELVCFFGIRGVVDWFFVISFVRFCVCVFGNFFVFLCC